MPRLVFIAFAFSLLAAIEAVAQQQGPAPTTSPAPPSITLEQAIAMARTNEPTLAATAGEAARFTNLTQPRESAREGAHADVVKAQLQQNSLTTSEIAREDGTIRYQSALTNLQLLTGAL